MPTRRSPPGPSRSSARSSATPGSVRSTQPTTPRMNGVVAAVARNSRVSSRLARVWTRTVASTPAAASNGARSSGSKRPPDGGKLVGQPRVVGARRVPDVVVCVDDHAGYRTALRARSGPRCAQLGPQVGRDRVTAAGRGTRRGGSIDRTPATSEVTAGMGERELHRRGAQRDAVPLACFAEPAGPFDRPPGWPGRSRSARPGRGSASTPLFITPPTRTATPRSRHGGQQLGERPLVEQRVAAGEQHDVHVGLADEPGEHRRLVHPCPDGADHALRRGAVPVPATPRRWPLASGRPGRGCSAMSIRSSPSRSRLSSSERRTPSAL